MLTHEQLTDFSARGWVIQEDVFDNAFMDVCRVAMDEIAAQHPSEKSGTVTEIFHGLINRKEIFRDCFLNPTILRVAGSSWVQNCATDSRG